MSNETHSDKVQFWKPTAHLRFIEVKELDGGSGNVFLRRLLQQLWEDGDSGRQEWRQVPSVTQEAEL